MKLLVVIVSYKVADLTIDCLRSLSTEIGSVPGTKVAVCENGTGDDSEERIRRAIEENGWGGWVELTAVRTNLGFTGGNNVVIDAAMKGEDRPEYVLLLNADTLVRAGALSELVKFMDANPRAGIAGSQCEWPDGQVQSTPFRFQGIATEFMRGIQMGPVTRRLSRWNVVPPKPNGAAEVDWVAGASMIIRRQVIELIGGLDEDYYTYFDDIDYCLNAKRAGWTTWWVPQSRVIHLIGRSTGITSGQLKRRPSYWFEARRHFFLKNHGGVYAAMADAAFIVGFAVWRLRRIFGGWQDSPHMLRDAIRHSVFMTGFARRPVKNPAMENGK